MDSEMCAEIAEEQPHLGEQLVAIGESPEHQRLLAGAADNGVDPNAVRDYLWRIRAPRELPRLARISYRISLMLNAAVDEWHVDLAEFGLECWPAVLDYIVQNRQELARSIGSEFDKPAQTSDKSPFAGHYLTYWAPYPTYWLDHPTEDGLYVLLQAHLLFAFASDVSRYTLINNYESCTDWFFNINRRNPSDASRAVRVLSDGGPEAVSILKFLPVNRPPLAFARWLRGTRHGR